MPEATPVGGPSNRAAIVTGAARGIGLAIARRLAGDGMAVALWDSDDTALHEAAAGFPAPSFGLSVDVTCEASVAEAAAATWDRFGRIDAVINNAGILGPVAPAWQHDPRAFRRVLDVNLTGTFLVCRAVIPRLLSQAGPYRGRIVNMASIQGKEGMPDAAAYAASKAGVMALTKTMGKELARDGILVNCVAPAAVEATCMAAEISAERRTAILARIPMGRFVTLEEVAAMVAWLAGDECTFSTGAVFDLSGGRATY